MVANAHSRACVKSINIIRLMLSSSHFDVVAEGYNQNDPLQKKRKNAMAIWGRRYRQKRPDLRSYAWLLLFELCIS